MKTQTTQQIGPTQPTGPTLRTSSSIDGFVLRRMQSAAKLKWENASNKHMSQSERVLPTRSKSDKPRRQMRKCKSSDAALERPIGKRIMRGAPDYDWSQAIEVSSSRSKLKQGDHINWNQAFTKMSMEHSSVTPGPRIKSPSRSTSRKTKELRRQKSAASQAA